MSPRLPYRPNGRVAFGVFAGMTAFAALAAVISLMFVMSIFGVQSGVQSAAGGCQQFGDSAWATYGADGDGDGKKDLYDPADAAFGTANYMHTLHIEQQPWNALLGYSGSSQTNTTYPRVVLTEAARWRGQFTTNKTL